jgi:PAS domain S-box-containing protein
MGKDLVQAFVARQHQAEVGSMLDCALGGLEASNVELPMIARDGKCLELLLSATSRRDNAGAVVGVLCICQDITLRKHKAGHTKHRSF